MAYYGAASSNYFRVKDEQAFRDALSDFDVAVVVAKDGSVSLYSEDEDGRWPVYQYPDGEEEDLDFLELISGHLSDGEVAVLTNVSFEGQRFPNGYGQAVNSKNEQRNVRLQDSIHTLAKELGLKD